MPADGQNSGAAFEVSKAAQVTSAQNVFFSDADSPWAYHISSDLDSTYSMGGTSDASLADFLSRPLKIATYQWTPEAQLFETFNPWSLYFNATSVKQKLNFFRNFRCTLCIKIMLNGNAFYYGRALLSYNPYLADDDVSRNRAFFTQDLVGASQKPHILLDPCSSQGAEMCLPFVYPFNWFDITSAGWEDDMGECIIHDFNVLKHANGGTDPITVNIFAWAENVELCIPTTLVAQANEDVDVELDEFGYPIPYEAQAKGKGGPKRSKPKKKANNMQSNTGMSNNGGNQKSNDEFKKDGMISKPASAIAGAANALSMIPIIAPYAKATAMVATRVGQIAKIFGYSRPQIVSDIQPYVPRFAGNLTNTDTPEAIQKLSVDTKNELTIDSRVNGMDGTDELVISSITSRESFIHSFTWAETAVTDDVLWSMEVDPTLKRTLVAAPVTEIHQTALGFASTPFSYWQGSLKFRFQIICSEYHRGRLRIVYDPNQLQAFDYNLTYSTVVDIAEERDFEYEVKWTKPKAWQRLRELSDTTTLVSSTVPVIPDPKFSNGSLTIQVLNELATPSMAAADVQVLVWVSGGDDYALSVPRSFEGLQEMSVYQEQSSWAPLAKELPPPICHNCGKRFADCICSEFEDISLADPYDAQAEDVMVSAHDDSNAPVDPGPIPTFGEDTLAADNQYLVYQGERILSFRELLRRYHYHDSLFLDLLGSTNTYGIRTYIRQNFPKYRGWDPNGSEAGTNSIAGTSPYSFCATTLMNYLTPAFVCRRGSIRWKYIVNGPPAGDNATAAVSRWDIESQNLEGFDDLGAATGVNNGGQKRLILQNSLTGSGAQVTPLKNNPVLEVELPFYTAGQRFVPARDVTYNVGRDHFAHIVHSTADASTESAGTRFESYVATGEDFNLSFFIGAPIVFAYADPVAA